MFDFAIDGKLRGCDLLSLKIGDVINAGMTRNRATIIQCKTGRPEQFEIMTEARRSLEAWLGRRGGCVMDFVFPSHVNERGHLSTRQFVRIVDEWESTGNLRAVQILLGYSNIQNTVRNLGVDVDDALTLSKRTDI